MKINTISNLKEKNKEKGMVRFIFQNLLITFFMMIIYFYTSEISGSISAPYIGNQPFTFIFSFSMLLFSVLSVLAGSLHGFISGFFGELLYQLAFYNTVYIEWCIITALFGFLSGLYKYSPSRASSFKYYYFSFIIINISALITTSLIIFIHVIMYSATIDIYAIFINYGFKFFIQILLSIMLFSPLLVFIYDKFLGKKEREIYKEVLTHHPPTEEGRRHAFCLSFGCTNIHFCSRCSGVVIGSIFSYFFTHLMQAIFSTQFPSELAILLCLLVPIPGLIDWGTQKLLYRTSNTRNRLFTGFIIGFALLLIPFTKKYILLLLLILVFHFSIFFLLIYFGQKKAMRIANEEWEIASSEFLEEEDK